MLAAGAAIFTGLSEENRRPLRPLLPLANPIRVGGQTASKGIQLEYPYRLCSSGTEELQWRDV
jgi:hypothetical protein